MRRLIAIGFAFFSIIYSSLSFSDASFTQRKDVQAFVEMMVKNIISTGLNYWQ